METLTTRHYRSRWKPAPLLGKNGEKKEARIHPRDIEAFAVLDRFGVLPLDYVHALIGGNLAALRSRFNLLWSPPNFYLSRPDGQRRCANANYRYLVYANGTQAKALLRERGHALAHRRASPFPHQLMESMIAASIHIGIAGSPDLRLIDWNRIKAETGSPAASIPLPRGSSIVPDWEPFIIEYAGSPKSAFRFFPGFEADTGTEPVDAADLERSSIRGKFEDYLSVVKARTYESHFGVSTFFIPFVTTTERRMTSMIALLLKLTGGKGSPNFLFKHVPSFTAPERLAPPTGHMLTDPWQRAGFPPINLDTIEGR
ncbi:hypothetical protein [Rhodoplanes elegans]|uniref:hypothetical protein n=1 Tax=Rhodoplanes elegans TaxID=29408 RepID=UPI0011B93C0D|nr:hypothetical protein [Rhodoplanes elegans]